MSKEFNETLIRNLDAGFLYWKIKDDKIIKKYEYLKSKIKYANENGLKEKMLKEEVEELSKVIFSFSDKEIVLDSKDVRYRYTGTLADSLMSRKLRETAEVFDDNLAFRTVKGDGGRGTDYTDIIINLKFKSDVMIPDEGKVKRAYNPQTGKIENLPEKKMKKLISKKKLRQMAYKDGVMINGIHYVNYQRTSSKARTGNDLFIDERYFHIMEEWQNMGIPFRKMVRGGEETHADQLGKTDIVSIRSYQSLTSSSIIGTLSIDPDKILLIDDISGEYTMVCNVVKSVPDERESRLKVVKENYTQKTDLWDGQSLLDKKVFDRGKYFDRQSQKYYSYSDKGFMLLRNHFFKTAVFNTNLQNYYKDRFNGNDNPKVYDKYGEAFNPEDILMVTTKNSVKILKFADVICAYMISDDQKVMLRELEAPVIQLQKKQKEMRQCVITAKRNLTVLMKSDDTEIEDINKAELILQKETKKYNENYEKIQNEIISLMKPVKKEQERLTWRWYRDMLKSQNQKFGVCKYEKVSKFGDKQQLWYQVLGSLNLNKEKLWNIAEPQINEINLMKKHPAFFRHYLNFKENKRAGEAMMLALLSVNDDVSRTKWYADYRRSQISSILKKLYKGKVQLAHSDFCVLVGNPYEMLRASAGDKVTGSVLNGWECWCQRYKDGEELYGFRSPHICSGNSALLTNKKCDEWRWFNFTDRIIVVNFWGKGAFLSPRWNGCDTDSDSAYIGNEATLLNAVRETRDFLIPINSLKPEPKILEYTEENMATVDGQLCNDFIGKVCNLARDLQGFYWHLFNTGTEENKKKYLGMIYSDICLLEVLSNIAIDSAKRRYDINIASEIKLLKERPYMKIKGAIIANETLMIKRERYKRSLSEDTIKDYEDLVNLRNDTVETSKLAMIDQEIDKLLKTEDTYYVQPDFTKNLKANTKKISKGVWNEGEKKLYHQRQFVYEQEQKILKEKIYYGLESPMDLLAKVVNENINRCDRTKYITFVELLNKIPQGVKADYNRVNKIKEICLNGITRMNQVQRDYTSGKINFDEMYEEKCNIEQNIIYNLKYKDEAMADERKITEWDIHLLLRNVYDTHPKRDKHGKILKDENGKAMIVDKRDKDLIDARVGGLAIQWVYAAFPDVFIRAIKQNSGTVSSLAKIDLDNKTSSTDSDSQSDTQKMTADNDKTYILYGRKYKIVTEPYQIKKNPLSK